LEVAFLTFSGKAFAMLSKVLYTSFVFSGMATGISGGILLTADSNLSIRVRNSSIVSFTFFLVMGATFGSFSPLTGC
jgi:hypothetical protein